MANLHRFFLWGRERERERGKVYFMLFVKFYIKLAQIKTGDNKILHKF